MYDCCRPKTVSIVPTLQMILQDRFWTDYSQNTAEYSDLQQLTIWLMHSPSFNLITAQQKFHQTLPINQVKGFAGYCIFWRIRFGYICQKVRYVFLLTDSRDRKVKMYHNDVTWGKNERTKTKQWNKYDFYMAMNLKRVGCIRCILPKWQCFCKENFISSAWEITWKLFA